MDSETTTSLSPAPLVSEGPISRLNERPTSTDKPLSIGKSVQQRSGQDETPSDSPESSSMSSSNLESRATPGPTSTGSTAKTSKADGSYMVLCKKSSVGMLAGIFGAWLVVL